MRLVKFQGQYIKDIWVRPDAVVAVTLSTWLSHTLEILGSNIFLANDSFAVKELPEEVLRKLGADGA